MDLQLQGKKALISASSSGLGLATAIQLAKEGADIVICGRNEDRLNQAVNEIKNQSQSRSQVFSFATELSQLESIEHLIDFAGEKLGGLDILITNAGGPPPGRFDCLQLSDWHQAFALTLMSCTYLIRTALPLLRQSKNASILTITSISTKQPIPGLILSNVFRPGVVGLTKTLSQELGPENIRVNSILPGWTMTEHAKRLLTSMSQKNKTTFKEEYDKVSQATSLKRLGQPEEFSKAAVFLVSPAASYITGVMLQVDGGSYGGLF
jgi:3-oxoacyl-[acyl-carrier protein] reductase